MSDEPPPHERDQASRQRSGERHFAGRQRLLPHCVAEGELNERLLALDRPIEQCVAQVQSLGDVSHERRAVALRDEDFTGGTGDVVEAPFGHSAWHGAEYN